MNIHKSQLFGGSLGTRVLTHPQMAISRSAQVCQNTTDAPLTGKCATPRAEQYLQQHMQFKALKLGGWAQTNRW